MAAAFHETAAPQASGLARFAPRVSFVLVPVLFAGAAVVYAGIVRVPDCRTDLPASAIFYFSMLAWLAARSLASSRAPSAAQSGGALLPSWSFIALGFCPSALLVLHAWRACLATAPAGPLPLIEVSYRAAFVVLATLFLVAAVDTIGTARKADGDAQARGVSEYVTMPAVLIALALYLGSPHRFSYFSDVLPDGAWLYVRDLRYAAVAFVLLLVLADAFFILSPLLGESRNTIDALADRIFPPRAAGVRETSRAETLALAIWNGVVLVLRYLFQFLVWSGLSVAYLAVAVFRAAWRFALNAGTQFALALAAVMYAALWLASKSLGLLASVREIMAGSAGDGTIAWFLALLFFFLLGLCTAHTYVARPGYARLAAVADGTGVVAGFAVVGLWIASIILHLVASLAAWANFAPFQVPGFAGLASLGLFFRVMLGGLFVVSVTGLISLRLARRRAA